MEDPTMITVLLILPVGTVRKPVALLSRPDAGGVVASPLSVRAARWHDDVAIGKANHMGSSGTVLAISG